MDTNNWRKTDGKSLTYVSFITHKSPSPWSNCMSLHSSPHFGPFAMLLILSVIYKMGNVQTAMFFIFSTSYTNFPRFSKQWEQDQKKILWLLSRSAQATVCYHKLGSLYTTEMGSSQFWRLEVRDQGAHIVLCLVRASASWLTEGQVLVCPHMAKRGSKLSQDSHQDTNPIH